MHHDPEHQWGPTKQSRMVLLQKLGVWCQDIADLEGEANMLGLPRSYEILLYSGQKRVKECLLYCLGFIQVFVSTYFHLPLYQL